MREREDELSSVPWSRLRRPGSLSASLAAAAMAHSPVQAGLPGMQVRSCPKGRHGRAPRAGVGVRGGFPGLRGQGSGRKRLLALARPRGQRSGMETKRAVSAWRGAQRALSARWIPACLCLPPSLSSAAAVSLQACGAERSVACGPLPRPGVLGVLIPEANRGSVGDFRPRNLRWIGEAYVKPVRKSRAWKC